MLKTEKLIIKKNYFHKMQAHRDFIMSQDQKVFLVIKREKIKSRKGDFNT